MTYIGIDPGISGAMAIVYGDPALRPYAFPFDEEDYVSTMRDLVAFEAERRGAVKAVVEHVHSMPKQGVASSFKFGQNFGWILGALSAIGISYELVNPQKWKREFSCTSDKNTSIAVARRMFPDVSLLATPKCRKPHDGMAEALLMAEYCRRRGRA